MAANSLHPRQVRILRCIRYLKTEQDKIPTQSQIAQHTGISKTMVNYHLNKLVRLELITKRPHEAKTVRLTKRGLAYLQATEAAT